jgi:hypothetical protein
MKSYPKSTLKQNPGNSWIFSYRLIYLIGSINIIYLRLWPAIPLFTSRVISKIITEPFFVFPPSYQELRLNPERSNRHI